MDPKIKDWIDGRFHQRLQISGLKDKLESQRKSFEEKGKSMTQAELYAMVVKMFGIENDLIGIIHTYSDFVDVILDTVASSEGNISNNSPSKE